MSTIMSTGNSSGETGRCDAKCYDAKNSKCHCCCNGINHGVGISKAIENVNQYANEMINELKKDHPGEHFIISNLLF